MLEEHSVGLIAASVASVVIYFFGLVVNFSNLALQYTSSTSLMQEILREGVSNTSSSYVLPVSLAAWSASVWGIVFVCQFFWLAFALTGICRQTVLGPVYNNPKLLPVQVHIFFSLAVLTQVGWLVLMDRERLTFALLLVLLSVGCSIISLSESYRALSTAQPMLLQEERTFDLWAVRLLAHNALAFFMTWITLHGVMTFALFLTFGMERHHLTVRAGSLVELCFAGFLTFVYVLSDLTVFDKYSRYVLLPYLGFVVFHAAQLNKNWPDIRAPVFGLLAGLMAFTFLYVLIKVVVLLCRHVLQHENENNMVVISRPLAAELEEETYLLKQK